MSRKIAMIGAGSVVLCKMLMSDIMTTPVLAGSKSALMSRTWPKMKKMEAFAKRMIKDNNIEGTQAIKAQPDPAQAVLKRFIKLAEQK